MFSNLENWVAQHTNSAWSAGLGLYIAGDEAVSVAYAFAAQHYEAVWELTKNAVESPSTGMAIEASTMLARLYSLTGRFDKLADLESAVTNSPLKRIYGLHWSRAKELARWAQFYPGDAYKCGLYCLDKLTRTAFPGQFVPANILEQTSSANGWSAAELITLAGQYGETVEAIAVTDFSELPLPRVVHLSSEHFVFVPKMARGFLQVIDPIAEAPQWLLPSDLAREATGCVLVAGAGARPPAASAFRTMSTVEAAAFRGRCHGPLPNDRQDSGPCPNPSLEGCTDCDDPCSEWAGDDGPSSSGCSTCNVGMPSLKVSQPFLNPWVIDRPMTYTPAYGPKLSLDMAYNPRQTPSKYDSTVFGIGSTFGTAVYTHPAQGSSDTNWNNAQKQSSWGGSLFSYARVGTSGNDGEVLLPGGRWADFDFTTGTNSAISGVYYRLNCWLEKVTNSGSLAGVKLHFRNGSVIEYLTARSPWFLMSARRDPQGNANTFTYGSGTNTFLSTVTAADGTTFSVTNSGSGIISGIGCSAGRSVTFAQADGVDSQLSGIADAAGLSTTFVVTTDSNSLPEITEIDTPYGATQIGSAIVGFPTYVQRQLYIRYPNYDTEQFMLMNDLSSKPVAPTNFVSSQIPTNTPLNTLDTSGRNERNIFHWKPQAMSTFSGGPDLTGLTTNTLNLAETTHWLATSDYNYTHYDTISWRQLPSPASDGSVEGGVIWYDYPGKSLTYEDGTQVQPSVIAKVMADGSTWCQYLTRDNVGKVLTKLESWMEYNGSSWVQKTRGWTNSYSADGYDLVKTVGPNAEMLVGYGYETPSRHIPTLETNASGYVTTRTYDTSARLATETTPLGEWRLHKA
jgi:YD repeat-containing protein